MRGGRQGVVLLQPAGPKVRDGPADEQGDPVGILEGDGERPVGQPTGSRRGDA